MGELVREIAPLVEGLVLREVLPRPPRDVLLVFAARGDLDGPPAWRVLVSADGDAPRLHVMRGRFERHEGPLGPFFRKLSGELAGLEVRALRQIGGDRIVALELKPAPKSTAEARTLVAELVGRHSNLVVLGPGDRVIEVLVPAPEPPKAGSNDPGRSGSSAKTPAGKSPSSARPSDASKSHAGARPPRLVVGAPYAPPPGRAVQAGAGGPTLAETLPEPATAVSLRRHETTNAAPLSWLVENALGARADEAQDARERREVSERLERKRKSARSLVFGLEQRASASDLSPRVRQDGELVKANLSRIARGAKSIEVEDWCDDAGNPTDTAVTRTIALDPKLSPHENLERLFERAKKLERARDVVAEELALARTKLASLDALTARLAPGGDDPAAVERDAIAAGLLEPRQDAPPPGKRAEPVVRLPYKTFHALEGSEIRVGRNAKDNDDLTFRHASGNDVWLHTADTPGSHVVLRLAKGGDPHPEELIDAAHLAVHFSPLKSATRARVHVARRKEVHKPRGAKPGLVTLSGGKILDVRVQPERLQRLLGTHRASGPGDGS